MEWSGVDCGGWRMGMIVKISFPRGVIRTGRDRMGQGGTGWDWDDGSRVVLFCFVLCLS